MTPLAAALLMRAAAGDAGVMGLAGFDLARLGGDERPARVDPTADDIARLVASECPAGAGDEIVVCGRRSRTTYRVPPSATDRGVDRAPSRQQLENHSDCGTRQGVTGCFEGVPVLRVGLGGGITLLPTLSDPASARDDSGDR